MPYRNERNGGRSATKSTSQGTKAVSPFAWIPDFIDKYFLKMPRSIQVGVFTGFAILLFAGWLRIVAPEAWDSLWGRDMLIEGVLTGAGDSEILDASGNYFLSGTNLYVTKEHRNQSSPKYHFSWILKLDRGQKDNRVDFALMEGAFEKGTFKSTASELLKNSENGMVRLEFTDIEMTRRAKIGFRHDSLNGSEASISVLPTGFSPPGGAVASQEKPVRTESVGVLLRRLLLPEYSSSWLRIRGTLLAGGSKVMKVVADSLRSALLSGRRTSAGAYALVLSEFDSLSLFSSLPSYSRVFADPFYEEAAALVQTGGEAESNYMATLLHNLQDSRSLQYLFVGLQRSSSESAQGLYLYVIGSFSGNDNKALREDIRARLLHLNRDKMSQKIRNALDHTIKSFAAKT